MFNLGMSELILIAILALIFIGPKQLPEVAKTVGRLIGEFKKATGDISDSITKSALMDDLKKDINLNAPIDSVPKKKDELLSENKLENNPEKKGESDRV